MSDIGSLETICGCMFSGKSEELLRLMRRAVIAKQTIHVFKPLIDDRDGSDRVVSHSRREIPATAIDQDHPGVILGTSVQWNQTVNQASRPAPLEGFCWDADVVGIDEAQFFGPAIIDVVETLISMGKRVIVAGLDLDFRAEPFGSMPILMAKADHVTRLTAVCTVCGHPAIRTQRLGASEESVVIGGADKYAARCRKHYSTP